MKRRHAKAVLGITVIIVVAAVTGFIFRDELVKLAMKPTDSMIKEGAENGWSTPETMATKLDTPWSVAFLPDDELLVTERTGQMQRIGKTGKVYMVDGVHEDGEGGLLGVALHPEFTQNSRLYLYFTTEKDGKVSNQVQEYTLWDDKLTYKRTVLENIPAAWNHNGGAIAFGPDGKLYVTTGDSAKGELAQDTDSLAGKILRMNDDGSTPDDNPFDNLVWSYGHRNPQGITWDDQRRMWEVEHGPSGERHGNGQDELNRIVKGGNYGWPVIAGDMNQEGMMTPIAQSGKSETWAPSGIGYHGGSLYFAGLRGQTLYQAKIETDDKVTLSSHFAEKYGRLRAVAVQGDQLYFTTSNQDGRGYPADDDDKVIRVKLK